MEALFLKLFNLSMTAGWLILAIVVLRLIFRRAPRWAFCLLWGMVALRLICPLSLESNFSLVPDVQPPSGLTAEYRVADALIEIDPVAGETVIENGPILIPIQDGDKTAEPSQSDGPVIVARSSAGGIIRVSAVAAWVWLVGLILMAGYALVSYLLLRRRVATATLLRENIKQSERVDSPFVLGLFRPTIYLPYSMDEGDTGHVIAHERAHIRRGDHWWKPLGFLLLAVYWFNPLVWAAYILFCRDMELACDEKVAAHMAHEERQAYSTALLHCGVRRRTVAACPLAFGEVGVKSRVRSVMHYKKPAFWVVLVAVVVCIAVAVCFLTVPKDDTPHTLEVTGLPAPEGGEDPYKKLEPAERAAAFLKNADKLSYELDPIRMHGTTLVPVLEYVPDAADAPTDPETTKLIIDSSRAMLDRLHEFDLSALKPLEIEAYSPEHIESAVIHVGDARCRMTLWYEQDVYGGFVPTGPLVFTFADGSMCAFHSDNQDNLLEPLHAAIGMSNSGLGFILQEGQSPWGSRVTVTELATGARQNINSAAAAYVECVFKNTPLLSEQVKSEAEFPWKIEILDGGTYWYNPEQKLMTTEDNKVYSIGGFEPAFSGDTKSDLLELLIPGSILTPFGYQVTGGVGGNIKIEPPASGETPVAAEPEPESKPGIPAPEGGEDPYKKLEPAERAAAFLKNADKFSYELGAIFMYGSYIVPVMEYVPPALARPDNWPEGVSVTYLDRTDYILDMLHRFDLSALETVEIEDFEVYATRSGVAYVGDACCRVAVWNEGNPLEDPSSATTLVFTFSDGTMCAFDGGPANPDNKLTDILEALDFAASEQAYLLYPKGTGGNVTVTKLSTGESRALHPAASAYVECIFENTPRLSDPVKSEAEFPWKIELQNGSTYRYNPEQNLLMTEGNKVYAIGGFENQEGSFTMESLVSGLVTNGFEES